MTLLNTNEAAHAAHVPAATIRTWAHRGLIAVRDRDERGRPLYDQHDILTIEKQTRRKPRLHRLLAKALVQLKH